MANKPQIDCTSVEISKIRGSSGVQFRVVDNGSAYMQKLYAHVESDPKSGITPELDYWTAEATSGAQRDYFLQAADRGQVTGRAAIATYIAELATRDASFRVPADRELAYQETTPGTWRSYYLEKRIALTGTEVSLASRSVDPTTFRSSVMVDFTPSGTRVFGDLTEQITGKKLAVVVGDTVESAAIVNGPIRGGRVMISMGGDHLGVEFRDAQRLTDLLVDRAAR